MSDVERPALGRFSRLASPKAGDGLPPWEAVQLMGRLGGRRWPEALALFQKLQQQKRCSTIVWNSVMNACAAYAWQHAIQLLELLEADARCEADAFSYNAVLAALMKSWQINAAVRLLHDMPSRQILPDTCSFNTVMGTLAREPAYCDHVLSMLEECQRGPGPNFWSFNIAISACSRAGRWQQAIDFLEVMRSARHQPDEYSFTSAISGCKASSNQAVELLRSMQDARLQASIVTYGAVISSRAGNGDWKGALALLDEARDQGLEITTIAFNAVLDSCEKGARWELALHLLQEMSTERIARSTSSYNSVLRACGACRRWQRAVSMLTVMRSDHCAPDVVSMNGLMAACVRGQAWARALEMRTFEPDEVTFTSLLTACGVGQQYSAAMEIYHEIPRPTVLHANALLGVFERAGHWQEALHFLQRLKGRGANQVSYSATIAACGSSSCWEWAMWLLNELRQRPQEDGTGRRWAAPYYATVQACRPSCRWREALLVLGAMRSDGDADRSTFTATVSVLQADGRWRLSLGLLEEMQASRLQADVADYRQAVLSLEEQHWCKAIDFLDEARATQLQLDEDAYRATLKVLQSAGQDAAAGRLKEELTIVQLKADDTEGRTDGMSNRLLRQIGGALNPV